MPLWGIRSHSDFCAVLQLQLPQLLEYHFGIFSHLISLDLTY
mgnify:CR=1 FL=1